MEASLSSRRPDYLLKVRGMSMRDAGIMDGDLLAVQKARDAKNGQIVVARLGDDVTVKRLRRTKAGIELIPRTPISRPSWCRTTPPISSSRASPSAHTQHHADVTALAMLAPNRPPAPSVRHAPCRRARRARRPNASSSSSSPISARRSPPTCG